MARRLLITRPDDFHVHLRDADALALTVGATARQFGRAVVMPNLRPPVRTVDDAAGYRERILAARPDDAPEFEPLMTLYLTPQTSPQDVRAAAASPFVHAIKLYPAGATTNADAGVASLDGLGDVLSQMQDSELPLLIHGESIDPNVDVFDREAAFIEATLTPLVAAYPRLRVVFEHITTAEAVRFVESASSNVGATVTAHHLLHNRNDIFRGGVRPHFYCLPVLKRERHRLALVEAVTSGNPKFFAGTDSAPHERGAKESACGCAGIYTAHAAVELYAEAFDDADAIERLEPFVSHHGADFYRLARNRGTLELREEAWQTPQEFPLGDGVVIPLGAGEQRRWRCLDSVGKPSHHSA